jgi:hypothetical protein
MNCLTGAAKRLYFILGVLSFCLFIAGNALAQNVNKADTNGMLYRGVIYTEGKQTQDGFSEDFDQGRADNWLDDRSGVWSVTDKLYRMNGMGEGVLRASCYNAPFNNFAYQMDVRRTVGNPDASQGMVFRLASNGDFYVFAIASSGYYSAYKFDSLSGVEMIPWTASPVVKQGTSAWNTMKIVCKGPSIDFFVNGTLLKTVQDNTPYLSGMVGVFAVDEKDDDQGNPIVDFDNIKLSISGNFSPSDLPVN